MTRRRPGRVLVAVALAVTIVAVELIGGLSAHGERLASTNALTPASDSATLVAPGKEHCQADYLPADAAQVRVFPGVPGTGPPLGVTVSDAAGRVVARATSPGGYPDGQPLTFPIAGRHATADPARTCIRNDGREDVYLADALPKSSGQTSLGAAAGERPVRVDYMMAGRPSGFAIAARAVRRAALMKSSLIGEWTIWLVPLVLLGCAALGVWLIVRGSPRAMLLCAAVAVLHATAWAVVDPVFQAPDEPVHAGYAQYLAEHGALPPTGYPILIAPRDLDTVFTSLPWSILARPTWQPSADRALERKLDTDLSSTDKPGGAGYIAGNPPLYYAAAAVAYKASEAAGGDLLDSILLMRLVSALLAGITVCFVWLLLRELLPGTPWAWTLGALVVALEPLFGFMSGGVNNDNLVNCAGAAFLWAIARSFRRGLNARTGLVVGAAVLVGLLAKISAYSLILALLVILVIHLLRGRQRRPVLLGGAVALAASIVPFAIYFALSARSGTVATGGLAGANWYDSSHIREQISYLWQWWLPKLPFMTEQFPGYPHYPLWDTYFQGFVGRFGWFQFGFSEQFYDRALIVWIGLALLAVVALVRYRAVLRARWGLGLALLAAFACVAGVVNVAGYRYREITGQNFEQARYLLPMVGLYGGFVAVAAKGAGRWGKALAAFLVVLAAGHALGGLLDTMGRYYT